MWITSISKNNHSADTHAQGAMSLRSLKKQLEVMTRDNEAEHECHLWSGPEMPPVPPEEILDIKYTKNVKVSSADDDLEHMHHLLQDTNVNYKEKVIKLTELSHKWVFKQMDQETERKEQTLEKKVTWMETEDAMFNCSSDDSDGIDPDHDDDWRDATRQVFCVCRELEVHSDSEDAVQKFSEMLNDFRDTPITLTERLLIWGAVRMMYRKTEPVHSKLWLSGCTELVDGVAFRSRPSLSAFLHVATQAAEWPGLDPNHRRKAKKWAARCMSLFHKRLIVLKEFGTDNPSWDQVKVSDYGRTESVPGVLLHNLNLEQQNHVSPPAIPEVGVKKQQPTTTHMHFPCDGSRAMPHAAPPP
eukprot:TRINITY_DN5539_c0_g1_i1.p1 TRINITY_DN5539_c0_g1~~TRINITY_DN5539_c0_g1_i1.p1  ORF type:complete len:358 (+),score=71.92 TRINITY_DN5539_c0_g1_i1:533-1606(+)